MAALSLPGRDSEIIARFEFRRLLEPAIGLVAPDDAYAIEQGLALDGLLLDLTEDAQARRIAAALLVSARNLVEELRAASDLDGRDEGFVQWLADDLIPQLEAFLAENR